MNDNTKQQQRNSTSTYNHATKSTSRNRIRSKTTSPNRTSTNRSLSTNAVLTSMSREKSTTIRKNDNFTTAQKQHPGRSSHHLDIPSMVCDWSSTTEQQPFGYVNGDFTSGQICKLQLRDRSYCHSYNYYGDILTVGTATSIDFYDTSSTCLRNSGRHTTNCHPYSIIASVPHTAGASTGNMISAIVWINPSTKSSSSKGYSDDAARSAIDYSNLYNTNNTNANQQLLALSDLIGHIYLYSIDPDILESQGPTLIYSGNNSNGSQIRCLAAGYYPQLNNHVDEPPISLVLAAGDKSGCITIVAFDSTLRPSNPQYIDPKQFNITQQPQEHNNFKEVPTDDHYNSSSMNRSSTSTGGILGIAFELERGVMAICTSSGLVQAFSLPHLLSAGTNNTPAKTSDDHPYRRGSHSQQPVLLWTSQNVTASAIRCIAFGPNNTNTLMYGGYDKTIIMVDTEQWIIIRELNVHGTVRFDKQLLLVHLILAKYDQSFPCHY